MLRFLPDGWLEWLLRPLIMADPSGGIYFEEAAPDWRFASLLLLLTVGLLARRVPQRMGTEQGRLVLVLVTLLYVWAFAIGNGRYFTVGLLLVGPLLVLAARLLPGTITFRYLVLGGVLALQWLTVQQVHQIGHWGLAPWRDGPGLPVQSSPLREHPAVFVTVGTLTFSALVPAFHPQSRWTNVGGQRDITPGMREYPRLRTLLTSPLPAYAVVPENVNLMTPELQPNRELLNLLSKLLAPYGLALQARECVTLQSTLKPQGYKNEVNIERPQGFWFCALDRTEPAAEAAASAALPAGAPADLDALFDAVERRCPRFFPPGDARTAHLDGYSMRHYRGSDMRLYVEHRGRVLFKYWRALNPTTIGSLDDVRRSDFEINCGKVPGRYKLPWNDG